MTLQQVREEIIKMEAYDLVKLHEMGNASKLGLKRVIFLWHELKYGYIHNEEN